MNFDRRAQDYFKSFWLHVSTPAQALFLKNNQDHTLRAYTVSTSRFGLGEETGSYRTPRGWHEIKTKIGAGAPWGAEFKSRLFTGKIWPKDFPNAEHEDLILTRVLWLRGLEPHNLTTYDRYIYIHGTQAEALLGHPMSFGCIRMSNDDIIDLYDRVDEGTPVYIE